MIALYVMVAAAVIIVAVVIRLFFWAVDNGQYEDLDGPAHSILFDDEDPKHTQANAALKSSSEPVADASKTVSKE